jgi:hypothetical protein
VRLCAVSRLSVLPVDELTACPAGAADRPFLEALSRMLLPPHSDTPPQGAIALSITRLLKIRFGTRGLTVSLRCSYGFVLLLPASIPSHSIGSREVALRLKVIFARDAQYALVNICCQALQAQHVAYFF